MASGYNPIAIESAWYDWWLEQGFFEPALGPDGQPKPEGLFVIPSPPPNVTGTLHIGHALATAIQDSLIRWYVPCFTMWPTPHTLQRHASFNLAVDVCVLDIRVTKSFLFNSCPTISMHTLLTIVFVSFADDHCIRNRMLGKTALFVPGFDHAGISTQSVVEKRLWKSSGKTRHDLGREKFVETVMDWKNE